MTRELLSSMLGSRNEVDGKDATFTAQEDTGLELLLSSQSGGPAAVRKISAITLGDTFLTVEADEQTWCLAYDDVMGIRLKPRSTDARARTGFRA